MARKIPTIAKWINEHPALGLRAFAARSKASTDRPITGSRLIHKGRGRWGTLLTVTDVKTNVEIFRHHSGDCVVRAIAIAAELPYPEVYAALNEAAQRERPRKGRRRSSSRTGVHKATIRRYLEALGWAWTPTMGIGTGCTVHLREEEIPRGRLIVSVSRHMVAVIDGVIHDTHDSSRDGTRCVYGYWKRGE